MGKGRYNPSMAALGRAQRNAYRPTPAAQARAKQAEEQLIKDLATRVPQPNIPVDVDELRLQSLGYIMPEDDYHGQQEE